MDENEVEPNTSDIIRAVRDQNIEHLMDLLKQQPQKMELDKALLQASEYGRKEIVRALITAGANVNFRPSANIFPNWFEDPFRLLKSAISLASKNGHNEVVDILVAAGAKDLDEALLQASECGRKEIVRALITAGANVNIASFCQRKSAVSLASKNGHNEVVDMLVAAGAKELDEALLQASECGRKEIVRALITAGANVNFRPFCQQKSAISLASKNGHNEVVDVLVAAGAKDLDEALLQASECGRKEIVRALITAGANVNFRKLASTFRIRLCDPSYQGKSAISLASKNGHNEIVDILLAAGAKDLDEALLEASECGRKEIVRALITAGANVNFRELDKGLLQAGKCGIMDFAPSLIIVQAEDDINFIRKPMFPKRLDESSNLGKSAISLASENGHSEVVDMLLAAGAKEDLDEALLQASKCGRKEIVRALVTTGADVNFTRKRETCESNTFSAISLASENGHNEVVDMLLAAGAKEPLDEAFSQAFKSGQKEIVDSIISAVARVNFIKGLSMKLVSACEYGQEKMVELLLSAGANVNYTVSGVSPIRTALKKGHKSIIKMLLLARAKVDPSILFREMLDVTVSRHGYKMKLLDKLLQVDAKISAADVVSLPRLLDDLADYVLKTKTIEETVFCFLLTLMALLMLQTTVIKQEMRKFTKLTFKLTGSDKVSLLCCHDVEQHPGPLSEVMKNVYRGLFSNLFLFYWGVKDKKEFTKLAQKSPDKHLNARQLYADENKPRNWKDQYCFDDPSNPRKHTSYEPHEKCSMLLGMVDSCYTENKIPEECVLQELEAFTDKDDNRLKVLEAKKQLRKTLLKSMSALNVKDLNDVFKNWGLIVQRDTSRQNATEDVSIETDNGTDNVCQNGEASTSHTKTEKERLQDIIAKLRLLSKSLEEESRTENRPGRKRKAPGHQIDNDFLEDILEELAADSAKKTKRDDDEESSESEV